MKRYIVACVIALLACGNPGSHSRANDSKARNELERINRDLSLAQLEYDQRMKVQDSLQRASARVMMDSLNRIKRWHFNDHTLDSLARELGPVAIGSGDTTLLARQYWAASLAADSAHTRLELAQREKNKFMK